MLKEKIQSSWLKLVFIMCSILFVIPSWIYFFGNNKSVELPSNLEYCFFLNYGVSKNTQTAVYIVIISIMVITYCLIIKNGERVFNKIKGLFIFVFAISMIFAFSVPCFSSDIFYYMGVGRLAAAHGQNPYYTDLRGYVDSNSIDISSDTVMQAGYKNYWSNTTVVYGALWTIICTVISFLSFGNLNVCMILFKLLNVGAHVLNCYLIYKISGKKLYAIIYGLNPFILVEGIMNVHNDMIVLFLILSALYMLRKKKNIFVAIACLALATSVKYVAIFLLPVIIIYHYKDKNVLTRFLKCLEWGLVYVAIVAVTYFPYFKDINVFIGIITQQTRLAKGLYSSIVVLLPENINCIAYIRSTFISIIFILYTVMSVKLLVNKNVKLYKEMRKVFFVFVYVLILILTNFQPWYFIWLSAFVIWQKPKYAKLIIVMQIAMLYANIKFLLTSESYVNAPSFFGTFVLISVGYLILEQIREHRKRKNVMI